MECIGILEGHADAVGAVAMSPRLASYASKAVIAFSGGSDKIIKRWELTPIFTAHLKSRSSSSSSSFTPTKSSSSSHSVRGHDKDINSVALSPNDALLASCSQDRTIRLWDAATLSPLATLKGHKRGVWRVAFSPIDRVLASCASDRSVKLWSLSDYSCIHTFEGHTASVLAVKFVNRGQQLLSSASDGLIR